MQGMRQALYHRATEDERTLRRAYCSDSCKTRDYRHRRDHAIELKSAGRSAKEIAVEVGTDIDTVKRWIGKKKK